MTAQHPGESNPSAGRPQQTCPYPKVVVAAIGVAVAIGSWSAPARATIYDFSNEYYISSSAQYNSTFGVTSGFNHPGIYEETNVTTKTIAELTFNSTTSFQIVPGEFTPNDGNSALRLNGWSAFPGLIGTGVPITTGHNAPTNSGTGNSPAALNFQYLPNATVTLPSSSSNVQTMSGTPTAFNLTSITLFSNSFAVGATCEGLLGGVVVDTTSCSISPTVPKTFTLNWNDIDTLAVIGTSQQGSIVLENVNLTPFAPIPEPASLALLAAGLGFLGLVRRRSA